MFNHILDGWIQQYNTNTRAGISEETDAKLTGLNILRNAVQQARSELRGAKSLLQLCH